MGLAPARSKIELAFTALESSLSTTSCVDGSASSTLELRWRRHTPSALSSHNDDSADPANPPLREPSI
jgi:hypothetical protein